MKRYLALILCLAMFSCMFLTACGGGSTSNAEPSQEATGPVDASDTVDAAEPADASETPDMQVVEGASDDSFRRQTEEGTFVMAYDEEAESLDPTVNKFIVGWTVTSAIYDNIIAMDSDTGEIYCVLAESYVLSDDGLTLTIKLKDGITFSNGIPATSDDILFTLERLSVSSRFSTNYECIDFDNTTCPDDLTIEIKFNYVYAPFLSYFAHPAAALGSRDYFDEVGEDTFGRNPIGTGAYLFDSWTSGDSIILTRNDNYWGDLPEAETVIIRFITETTTRMVEYETGGVDVTYSLSGTDIDRARSGEISNTSLYTCQGENISVLEMYKGYEPLTDKNVRLAIAHAVDWEILVETVYGSAATLAESILPPDCLYYKPIGVYEYNPELSLLLLEEAGFAEGLVLTTYVYAGTESEVCEIVQAYLLEVGITMNIEIVDIPTMIGMQVSGECNFGLSNSTTTSRDPDQAISSSKMTSDYGIARITDQTLQDMYDAGAVETDPGARRQIYEDIAQYYFDEAIRIPVRVSVVSYAVRDYVDNFPASNSGIIDLKAITFK